MPMSSSFNATPPPVLCDRGFKFQNPLAAWVTNK